jgi:membrane-bound lytic murein transglycosylase MltF
MDMRKAAPAVLILLLTVACSRDPAPASTGPAPAPAATPPAPPASTPPPASTGDVPSTLPVSKGADEPLPPAVSPYDVLPDVARSVLGNPFTGDLDEMIKRRVIRVGVVYSRTHYFIDKGTQRGLAYEALKKFEDDLNERLKTKLLRVHVAFVPLPPDALFPGLRAGRVDMVAAATTITPERLKLANFTTPTTSDVSEIVVAAPGIKPVPTPDDLSGREVFVRKSSSYYESLVTLNQSLTSRKLAPVIIKEAPEALGDDDLLEMVNAGLVDLTVMDDFVVALWRQVFPKLQPQPAAVRTGADIGVGVRKENPKLLAALNTWLESHQRGTAFANTLVRRYLQSTTYVKSASSEAERRKLLALVEIFKKYGEKYDVDYLLMVAQGYQESQLNQRAKSHVGAVGVMQVMPATGRDLKVGDITQLEPNVHAGVKYFRFMVDQFYKDEPMDRLNKGLMTLASYNAGPGRIRQLRRETERRGLDPNKWFGNVEQVVSERIGRETVTYVGNIYKYYVAYRLVMERETERRRARGATRQ